MKIEVQDPTLANYANYTKDLFWGSVIFMDLFFGSDFAWYIFWGGIAKNEWAETPVICVLEYTPWELSMITAARLSSIDSEMAGFEYIM